MYTGASSINNDGIITIIAPDPNNHFHSYLYQNGTYTELKVPGADETFVQSISNSGDLALVWSKPDNISHGALYHKGRYYEFGPDNVNVFAFGINDNNVIVGS